MLEIVQSEVLLTLITIVLVEIVLGVDNLIVLFAILKKKRIEFRLRIIAMGFLLSILLRALILGTALSVLETTYFIFSFEVGWIEMEVGTRGLIFLVAGIYLIIHSVVEVIRYIKGDDIKDEQKVLLVDMSWPYMIFWVAIIDLVFSYDSILGVIAVSRDFTLLIIGLIISRILIILFLNKIYRFIHFHPEIMVVMLVFLGFIGISLLFEGLYDMNTGIFGLAIHGFPSTWLYSIFALGVIYSIVRLWKRAI